MNKRGTRAHARIFANLPSGYFSRKRSQITIFIIIGIIIIVTGILIYYFYPEIKSSIGLGPKNPTAFMQNCLEEKLDEGIKAVSISGGSIEPEFYFSYNNENLEYLCYVEGYYKTCVVQQPLLKKHIEKELKNYINADAKECLRNLKKNYEDKGYEVQMKSGEIEVELLPNFVFVNFNDSITLKKDSSEKYEGLVISTRSDIYELISIANSIIGWEAAYGDAETTIYMNYYHDLKVEKKKMSEGTTIYIITNRDSGDKFQFASRSLAWPPGYGLNEIY